MNIKEKLLAAAVVRTGTVDVEGETITVREISSLEFANYGTLAKTDKNKANASMIAACTINEDGTPMFTEEEALSLAFSTRMAMPIVNKIMILSGFGKDDEKENEEEKHTDAS